MTSKPDFTGLEARPYEVLSFVTEQGSLWAPARTGNYASDCTLGRSYAVELLAFIRSSGFQPLLGNVCAAMSRDEWGGVETGFFQVIAASAVVPAELARV